MNICIFGGTGLLGYAASIEAIARGHKVVCCARSPVPQDIAFPEGLTFVNCNYLTYDDARIIAILGNCDAMVFAGGVDERVEFEPPVYEKYKKYNVAPVRRLFGLAKKAGLKSAVLLGSYFTYFDRVLESLALSKTHPYICARAEQSQAALDCADACFTVNVLELPYIFGTQPGRKPVWTVLVERLKHMRPWVFYPRGGTAMVTVKQVGQAVLGALERRPASGSYPIGYYNLAWQDMIRIFLDNMGAGHRKIITVPDWVFALYARYEAARMRARGKESGLDFAVLPRIMCRELYIDPAQASIELGVTGDNLEAAIAESVKLALASMGNAQLREMRSE